jgi:uncharacterized membrane protein YtjA (UPF0391 family)
MKNLFGKYLAAIMALSMGILFTGCSKSAYTLTSTSKMTNVQAMSKTNVSHQTDLNSTNQPAKTVTLPTASCNDNTSCENVSTATVKEKPLHNKLTRTALAQTFHNKVGRIMQKQATAISSIGTNRHLASYSGTHSTASWLGAAVIFLIVGLVLAFLGFSSLGSLFWAIGVVLFVVGVVFFILWLLAANS